MKKIRIFGIVLALFILLAPIITLFHHAEMLMRAPSDCAASSQTMCSQVIADSTTIISRYFDNFFIASLVALIIVAAYFWAFANKIIAQTLTKPPNLYQLYCQYLF